MVCSNVSFTYIPDQIVASTRFIFAFLVLALLAISIVAQTNISQPDSNTVIIDDAPESEVFSFGKTVIVKKSAKGILSFGGDVIIEGKVTGDVATIGGSIIQKEGAFIGGDVIIFGGRYEPEGEKPGRNDGTETVMYAGYEEELRSLMQNPSQILSPDFSLAFLAQRLFSVLFWFIVSLALTTITPGAVSRAIARIQLSTLKVVGIGALGFIATTLTVMLSLEFLPGFVSIIVSLMAFVLVMLAYVFGRVALQAYVGKWVGKRFSPNKKPSEAISLLIGAVVWTALLSIPYLWTLALFILFTASLGLILTARTRESWKAA